jgi:VCBS repeat-containing protein
VDVTITGTNDGPVAANDSGTATERGGTNNATGGANALGNVLSNDSDPETSFSGLVVSSVRVGGIEGAGTSGIIASGLTGAHGTLTLNANGSYTYVVNEIDSAVQALNLGQSITDTFNYTMSDGQLSDAGVLTITISGADDAPTDIDFTANQPPSGSTLPGAGATIATLTTDDVDNFSGFTYSFSSGTGSGFALTASTGVLTATAALSTNSTYSLKFVSTDTGGLQTPEQTLTIITGTNGNSGEPLNGVTGDDVIYALSNGSNQNQHDVVFAGGGDDTVFGQDGVDDIHGGAGNDVLYGGAGSDTFYFDSALNASTNVDTIRDFVSGADKISLLKAGVFSSLSGNAGNSTLGTDFSANGTVSGSGGEHVFYDPATGNLYFDSNAGNHSDAILFATLTNTNGTHPNIATTDFIIG